VNICIFGDSITWGAFLPFRAGWANLLRNYLESQDRRIALYDLGIDGNTSTDLLHRFDTEAAARCPDILIIAIGTNDSGYRQTIDRPLTPLDEFERNIQVLLERAKQLSGKILFVGLVKGDDTLTSPLPRSSTGKFYTKVNLKVYNDKLQKICQEQSVAFVDINGMLADEDFDDGLHPNLGGHQKIFEAVRRSLIKTEFLNPG